MVESENPKQQELQAPKQKPDEPVEEPGQSAEKPKLPENILFKGAEEPPKGRVMIPDENEPKEDSKK